MTDLCKKCPYKAECRELSEYELTCEEVKAYAEGELKND